MAAQAPLITVIVPACRAAATLPRAIASLRAQTVPDLAIRIVDDGSPDDTGAVADALARQDPRIAVRHQRNQGGYFARLNAARVATTPWLAFVDADDTAEPTLYAELLAFAQDNDLDVAECERVGVPERPPEVLPDRDAVFRRYIRPNLLEGRGASFVWDKLYRNTPALADFAALPIHQFDDLCLNLQFLRGVRRLGLLHRPLYRYDVNPGSSVRRLTPRHVRDLRQAIAFRRTVAPAYGLAPDDPLFDAWALKNARNFLVVAATGTLPADWSRADAARAITTAPEVQDALRRAPRGTHCRRLLALAARHPAPIILFLSLAARLRRLLPHPHSK